ncbi:TPR end-of-group domain-containing protein [Candidatus Uabimicrobium amorphum]|uniref:Adenylate cyclase n=1 Tax=Uabimicrobium amorphum TaxID=2596890 RepID=A0A5S9IQ50_UABAM|nr:HEAT repeat domain-containing protein [Candidatus Uabimicrobium amorphum]BBM86009.1 adenylate cyclase [Candidatus Uabimicrobium amorphum]
MTKIIILFTVVLFATTVVVGEKNDEYVSALLESLNDENPIVRDQAAEKLSLQGEDIIPLLMENFSKDSYAVRRTKAYVIGQIETRNSIKYLLEILKDKDEGVRNVAACMLLNLSDKFPILEKLQGLRTTVPQIRETFTDLRRSIIYKEIEQELLYYVSPDGNSGYFTGQFAKLQRKWKHEAIIPLLDIFSDPEYRYVNNHINDDRETARQVRFLAGEGLADLKNIYTTNLRLSVKRALDDMVREMRSENQQLDDYIKGLVNKILYNIGYTANFDAELRRLKWRLRMNPRDRDTLFEIGMKYLQIGDTKNGILYLNKAVAVSPKDGITYYNLACAYSVAGRVELAMDALEKSVDYGYTDLDWMLKDGDLRNVRKHPRFVKLVKRLEKLNAGK